MDSQLLWSQTVGRLADHKTHTQTHTRHLTPPPPVNFTSSNFKPPGWPHFPCITVRYQPPLLFSFLHSSLCFSPFIPQPCLYFPFWLLLPFLETITVKGLQCQTMSVNCMCTPPRLGSYKHCDVYKRKMNRLKYVFIQNEHILFVCVSIGDCFCVSTCLLCLCTCSTRRLQAYNES